MMLRDCSKDPAAADAKLISCVVSNHGGSAGTDLIQFWHDQRSSISTALTSLRSSGGC